MSAPVCQSAVLSSDTSEMLWQTPETSLLIKVGFSLQAGSVNAKTVSFFSSVIESELDFFFYYLFPPNI